MKADEKIEKYLNEAVVRGFTLTCNKCGAEVELIKDNKIKGKVIKIDVGGEEIEDGYSIGIVYLTCKKCGVEWEMRDDN